MKTKTIGSLIVLLAIATTIASAPSAFAEHSMHAVVENAEGSSTPGCEPDCFLPATVTIGVGGSVEFVNNDNAAHTSTAGTPTGWSKWCMGQFISHDGYIFHNSCTRCR